MIKNLLLLLTITLPLIQCCQQHHENQELQAQVVDSKLSEKSLRSLQSQQPRNMVMTFDFSYYDKLDLTKPENVLFKEKTQQAIKIVQKYFSNLIKIVPKSPQDLRWDLDMRICGGGNTLAKIPDSDRTTDRDTDLHLYIVYIDDDRAKGQSWIAYAAPCRQVKGLGPTHGQVTFNWERLTKFRDLNKWQDFQKVVDVVIHEIIHVLGFNKQSWKLWVDKNKNPHAKVVQSLTIRGLKTNFICTPHVLEFARNYYNCPTLEGVPLENQGGSGNLDGHWENTSILQEIMRAVEANTKEYLTGFTAALLRDTGFYAEINEQMVEKSFFGKGAGCGFLKDNCNDKGKEYCNSSEGYSCDYYRNGAAECDYNSYYDTGCKYRRTKDNSKCYDPNHTNASSGLYSNYYGQTFGSLQSKCFMSNFASKFVNDKNRQIQPGCYQYQCAQDKNGNAIINIQLGGNTPEVVVCSKNGEQPGAINYDGVIVCPDNIQEFCQFPKLCPNSCNTNGYCQQGKCVCLDGYGGEGCEKATGKMS